ncbi:hypothetical protein [Streptomyces sp. NPDC059788]|uniref:hypothetical protein n=1 Tax=Streptomyces sp. NPDC059788 TaxID=3346948 RepID=UPI0036647AB9
MRNRINAAHRIEPWLANRLGEPLLAHLLRVGTWRLSESGMYAGLWPGRPDSMCHCVLFNRKAHLIYSYGAHHTDADCDRALLEPAPRMWLPAPEEEAGHPPGGAPLSGWRHVLRASATLPMQISWRALDNFAALTSGLALTPGTVGDAYLAAAQRARRLGPFPLDESEEYWVLDEQGRQRLQWRIAVEPSRYKPVVTQIRAVYNSLLPRVTKVRARSDFYGGVGSAARPRPRR